MATYSDSMIGYAEFGPGDVGLLWPPLLRRCFCIDEFVLAAFTDYGVFACVSLQSDSMIHFASQPNSGGSANHARGSGKRFRPRAKRKCNYW
jgi:hypothetical protein